MKEIEMTKMVEEMDLRNLTPEVDMTDLVIATPDINRPALQLTGYYEHFANERVQIIGYVEFTYLQHLEESERVRAFEEFVSRKIPCVIFTTKMIPGPEILELCNRYQVPAFAVDKSTSVFMAEIIRWLNVQLAPMVSSVMMWLKSAVSATLRWSERHRISRVTLSSCAVSVSSTSRRCLVSRA